MDTHELNMLLDMTRSKVKNYGIPGVDSSLLSPVSNDGCIRLFECSRDHQEAVTPHSHKFDFVCQVLCGKVLNRVWHENSDGDEFQVSKLAYLGDMGKYEKTQDRVSRWAYTDCHYSAGDWYSMRFDEVHSISFSRGTKVLFFEGRRITDTTLILDPHVSGKTLETFEVKPWMFEKTSN